MLHQEVVHETLTYSRAPALPDCDTLVRTHSSMVRRIAWQVHSRMSSAIALEDLMQIGLLSLVEAAKGFKDRGATFAPYAATRIRGAMIDHLGAEAGAQVLLGDRHADGVGDALAERPGGGLDAGFRVVFGMAGAMGAELAEMLHRLDRDGLVTGQRQEGVESHHQTEKRICSKNH